MWTLQGDAAECNGVAKVASMVMLLVERALDRGLLYRNMAVKLGKRVRG